MKVQYRGPINPKWEIGKNYDVMTQRFHKAENIMVWKRGVSDGGDDLITVKDQQQFNEYFTETLPIQ